METPYLHLISLKRLTTLAVLITNSNPYSIIKVNDWDFMMTLWFRDAAEV